MSIDEENKTKVFEKIGRYRGINMKRVPQPTLDIFMEFANAEFCNDYGMTLKYLVDVVFGEIPRSINDLRQRVLALEGNGKEVKQKLFKSNSGKVIEEVSKNE